MEQMTTHVGIEPGRGLVGRFGDTVILIPRGEAAAGPDEAARELLDLAAAVASDRQVPASMIAARLAAWVIGRLAGDAIAFGIVVPVRDGVVMFLRGAVWCTVTEGGSTRELSGEQALTWVDQIVPGTFERLAIGSAAAQPVQADPLSDLRDGVVPGQGFVLTRPEAPWVRNRPRPRPRRRPRTCRGRRRRSRAGLRPGPRRRPRPRPRPRRRPGLAGSRGRSLRKRRTGIVQPVGRLGPPGRGSGLPADHDGADRPARRGTRPGPARTGPASTGPASTVRGGRPAVAGPPHDGGAGARRRCAARSPDDGGADAAWRADLGERAGHRPGPRLRPRPGTAP